MLSPIRWTGRSIELINQLELPLSEEWKSCKTVEEAARAITSMVVRGAPAIGVTAAYAMVLAAKASQADSSGALLEDLEAAAQRLRNTRPTAVNLFWAIDNMLELGGRLLADADGAVPDSLLDELEARAVAIHREDIEMCQSIGRHGAELFDGPVTLLTHCNAGALATGGYGTALGVVRAVHEAGKLTMVFADETRPFLQGARLTAWELQHDRIPVTILPDSAAAALIARGEVDAVVVGADRIAANGDVANKIGTFAVALACAHAKIPFYVAAPVSTLDLQCPSGAEIPIEERSPSEVLCIGGRPIAPDGVPARNPAFDVTPAQLVTGIITDRGVATAPFGPALAKLAAG
jgi:methylthioribose-1-phosphate isomerase